MFSQQCQFHFHQLFLVTSSSKEEREQERDGLDTKDYKREELGERSFDTAFNHIAKINMPPQEVHRVNWEANNELSESTRSVKLNTLFTCCRYWWALTLSNHIGALMSMEIGKLEHWIEYHNPSWLLFSVPRSPVCLSFFLIPLKCLHQYDPQSAVAGILKCQLNL